jgi:uncharacterized membrane protein
MLIFLVIILLFISNDTYFPIYIYLLSLFIIIVFTFKIDYILGMDTHKEFFLFKNIAIANDWINFYNSPLDSSLNISLVPALINHYIKIDYYLFYKIFFSFLLAFIPYGVYLLLNPIIGKYSILGVFLYISQYFFINATMYCRSGLALFYIILILLLYLQHEKIKNYSILNIFLFIALIFSHYTSTYIFLFFILFSYIIKKVYSNKYYFRSPFNFRAILIIFSIIYVWYGLITNSAFRWGIYFIKNIYNSIFLVSTDIKSESITTLTGSNFFNRTFPKQVEIILCWIILFIIICGYYFYIKNDNNRLDFKIFGLFFILLLFTQLLIPYLSIGYSIERIYAFSLIILSLFFAYCIKELDYNYLGNKSYMYIISLLIIFLYFISINGISYDIYDIDNSIMFSDDSFKSKALLIHPEDENTALWASKYVDGSISVDHYGYYYLISLGLIDRNNINENNIVTDINNIKYLYLRYNNIKYNELMWSTYGIIPLSKYSHFQRMNNIYDNVSQIYINIINIT